jgi:hypothetical protein
MLRQHGGLDQKAGGQDAKRALNETRSHKASLIRFARRERLNAAPLRALVTRQPLQLLHHGEGAHLSCRGTGRRSRPDRHR